MSKQANTKMIGVFVVGAVVLLTAALVIFSSGKLFKKQEFFALYFEESVRGLNTGAPVYFRGVKVGAVSDVRLFYNPEKDLLHSAVLIELEPDRVYNLATREKMAAEPGDVLYLIEKKGLKAQLDLQSMVTGLLIITLDFHPDKELVWHHYMKEYQEIPTIPTQFEELAKTVQEIPWKDMVAKLDRTIAGIDALVNSRETQEGVKSLARAGQDTQEVMKKINEQITPLITELRATLAMKSGTTGEIATKTKETLDQAKATLKKVDENLVALKKFTQGSTEVAYQLDDTLREFSGIAHSLRALSEYLERHPEAIMTGKKKTEGDRR